MKKGFITLSKREIERLRIIHRVMDGRMTQVKASELLGITDRQVRNIIAKVRERGDKAIAHGNRERVSHRRMSKSLEERIAGIIEEKYPDFGPTLASEKLLERNGINVGREKLRQVMIAHGLWKVRRRRKRDVHQWRERKAYYGEMVQMDGSHHDWLEGRGPKLVFLGYIDDATNHVFGRFYDYEGIYPAMDSFKSYISLYGLPRSLYLDKDSTYKTTRQPDTDELLRGKEAETQFERACGELRIEVIHANSPQAKGRIERTFGTLQDRLIKEMRLAGVRTKEEANLFLEWYLPIYNERFSKVAREEGDLHSPLAKHINLREIFCIKGKRTINNGYIVKWRGRMFLIENPSIAMRRQKVEVMEHFNGEIWIRFKGRYLQFKEIAEQKPAKVAKVKKPVVEPKKKKSKYIPPADHPWRRHTPSLHHNCFLERI
ncbi:MAG: ISNCY family transposase [Candidatus Aminicenantes bacterium]|nr:ISNCY family transposase [Candidatus Aminicenantes bacterium]